MWKIYEVQVRCETNHQHIVILNDRVDKSNIVLVILVLLNLKNADGHRSKKKRKKRTSLATILLVNAYLRKKERKGTVVILCRQVRSVPACPNKKLKKRKLVIMIIDCVILSNLLKR